MNGARITLDPSKAQEADIFCWEDGKPWRAPIWPMPGGYAIYLCEDCGEIDEDGEFFEKNTVYSNMGDPGDTFEGEHNGCNCCKSLGYRYVGM